MFRSALVAFGVLTNLAGAQTWVNHQSGVVASLRGVSSPNGRVVWASGTGGTYIATTDGGATWHAGIVPGAEALDFRGVHGVDARAAYLLASGPGDKSRIYKTIDGGAHWTLQFTNPDPKGFFDAIAFGDARHGIVLGDPVDGEFVILTTIDGGEHWMRRHTPPALPNEGAFAASGTCLIVRGQPLAWFATGGQGGARVFYSQDGGRTWAVAQTPVRNDAAATGVFSLAFSDSRRGIVVGGDYTKPAESQHNIAVTSDGGLTWTEPDGPHPNGYRSAVAYVPDKKMWIAVGTTGSDISYDDGKSWKPFDTGAFNAVSFVSSESGWAVGPNGRLAQFRLNPDPVKSGRPAR
ncbi:MAG TPA: hypothetical protein VNX70_10105 [Bryobacteraceae bacterium]|nr:hypothetical protein [Bryobacteraceae bacterium]